MTPQDLKQIGNLFDKRFDKIDKNISEIKTDVSTMKSDIAVLKYKADKNEKALSEINNNILEWKSQMFDPAEVFMKKTKDQRKFREVGGYQLATNTHRIGDLETKVFGTIIGA